MHFIRLSFITTMILSASFLWAQNFSIGHQQTAFIDASRANRSVGCEIYYPSDVAGDNAPLASGSFPIVAFGHGFVMTASVYNPYWEGLVPEGYIVILPTTEGSLFPSHSEFGKDLAFLIQSIQFASNQIGSDFYGHVSSTSAVMGHSMGGGAAFLAMNENPSITALVAMAPAETNPSAISAASTINRPALIFSGINDCVAPPAEHQIPMYEALSSSCKTYLGIVGGDHCQFASPNFNCTFGQSTCSPQGTISATEQQADVLSNLIPWLDYYLKNDCVPGETFQSNIAGNVAFEVQQNCVLGCGAGITGQNDISFSIYPNPSSDVLRWHGDTRFVGQTFSIVDMQGRIIAQGNLNGTAEIISISNWSKGMYWLKVGQVLVLPFSKN
jgi:predicted dienelactone hydrolase